MKKVLLFIIIFDYSLLFIFIIIQQKSKELECIIFTN